MYSVYRTHKNHWCPKQYNAYIIIVLSTLFLNQRKGNIATRGLGQRLYKYSIGPVTRSFDRLERKDNNTSHHVYYSNTC